MPYNAATLNGSILFLEIETSGGFVFETPAFICPSALKRYAEVAAGIDSDAVGCPLRYLERDFTLKRDDYRIVAFRSPNEMLPGRKRQLGLLLLNEGIVFRNSPLQSWLGGSLVYSGKPFNFIDAGSLGSAAPIAKVFPEIDASKIPTSKSGCFIATVAFGGRNSPEVKFLQSWRDTHLAQTALGRTMIRLYYVGTGQCLAKIVRSNPLLTKCCRLFLVKFVDHIRRKNG